MNNSVNLVEIFLFRRRILQRISENGHGTPVGTRYREKAQKHALEA